VALLTHKVLATANSGVYTTKCDSFYDLLWYWYNNNIHTWLSVHQARYLSVRLSFYGARWVLKENYLRLLQNDQHLQDWIWKHVAPTSTWQVRSPSRNAMRSISSDSLSFRSSTSNVDFSICSSNSWRIFKSSSHFIYNTTFNTTFKSSSHYKTTFNITFKSSSHFVYNTTFNTTFKSSSHFVYKTTFNTTFKSSSHYKTTFNTTFKSSSHFLSTKQHSTPPSSPLHTIKQHSTPCSSPIHTSSAKQ